jgi:hypothetical protein
MTLLIVFISIVIFVGCRERTIVCCHVARLFWGKALQTPRRFFQACRVPPKAFADESIAGYHSALARTATSKGRHATRVTIQYNFLVAWLEALAVASL